MEEEKNRKKKIVKMGRKCGTDSPVVFAEVKQSTSSLAFLFAGIVSSLAVLGHYGTRESIVVSVEVSYSSNYDKNSAKNLCIFFDILRYGRILALRVSK